MSITDELRGIADTLVKNHMQGGEIKSLKYGLIGCADRIDAEYQKAIRELNNLADASVLLPVDADGVPIRVGDKVYQVEGGLVYTVKSITFYPENTTVSFECKHGFGCDSAHNVHHYHGPTVEDVLTEFSVRVLNSGHQWGLDGTEVIAEYAAKLRLADDGEGQ